MSKTFPEIMNAIFFAEEALRKAKQAKPWCHEYVENAMNKCFGDWGSNEVDSLIEELNERDFPMTRHDIEEVFKYAAVYYKPSHIDKCRPNSQECVDEEMRRYED